MHGHAHTKSAWDIKMLSFHNTAASRQRNHAKASAVQFQCSPKIYAVCLTSTPLVCVPRTGTLVWKSPSCPQHTGHLHPFPGKNSQMTFPLVQCRPSQGPRLGFWWPYALQHAQQCLCFDRDIGQLTQKLVLFIIKKSIFWIKLSKRYLIYFWKQNHWVRCVWIFRQWPENLTCNREKWFKLSLFWYWWFSSDLLRLIIQIKKIWGDFTAISAKPKSLVKNTVDTRRSQCSLFGRNMD